MKKKSLLTVALSIALSAGTVWADDDNHGNYVTKNVENIGAFENIISNASFEVEFTQRDVQKVMIQGDPAQIENVNLAYMGNTLIVGSKENTDVRDVKVIIEAPNLLCAVASGSGDIEVKYLDNLNFTATVTGAGDIELTGTCDKAEYTVTGSGDIDAEEFRVEYLNATVTGSGSIDCRCTETLNANVVGSGEIEIHGPTRMVNRSGRKAAIRHDH